MAPVTRTYLEMRDPSRLTRRKLGDESVRVHRLAVCHPQLWRSLYRGVGAQYNWNDRAACTDEQIAAYLAEPGVTVWVVTIAGEVGGFFQLRQHDRAETEIEYFGLLPGYIGRGLGRHLITEAAEQAWATGASRIWLHTNTQDHPAAVPNYLKAGFTVWRQEILTAP